MLARFPRAVILVTLFTVILAVSSYQPVHGWGFGSSYFRRGSSSSSSNSNSDSSSPSSASRQSFYRAASRMTATSNNNDNNEQQQQQEILEKDNTAEEVERAAAGSGIGAVVSSIYSPSHYRQPRKNGGGGGEEEEEEGSGGALEGQQKQQGSPAASSAGPAAKLLQDWERKGTHAPCWKVAVMKLKTQCKDVLTEKDERTRLTLEFMACQLEIDGKDSEPVHCVKDPSLSVATCSSRVPESLYAVYIQFSHHVDTLCFHIQEELLHFRTKQIVDRLGVASSQAAQTLAELSIRSAGIDEQMQTMQVSQKQATASAETLATALRQVSDLGGDIKQIIQDDRINVEAIADKVSTLLETHESMRRSNEALAASLKVLADDHVQAVGQLGVEVDETKKKLLSSIDGLHGLQAKTSRFVGSLDAALHYGTFFIVVWLVTTASRTQDSRFFAMICGPVSSMLAERYVLHGALRMFSMFGLAHDPDEILTRHHHHGHLYHDGDDISRDAFIGASAASLLDPTPLRNFFILVAIVVVVFYAVFFETPEQRQRRVLQIEISAALATALGKTSPSGGGGGGGGSGGPRRITPLDDDGGSGTSGGDPPSSPDGKGRKSKK